MLNYTSHAIETLKRHETLMRRSMPMDGDAISALLPRLRGAEKFILPPHGSLIFDMNDVPEGLEVTRLPYPAIVMEVPFPSKGEFSENVVASTKRVILAEEVIASSDWRNARFPGPIEIPNAIMISIICWYDHDREWLVQAVGGLIPIGEKSEPGIPDEKDPYAANRVSSVAFRFMPYGVLPGATALLRQQQGPELFAHTVSNDVGTEIRILAEMLAVLSCRNVATETVSPQAKLAKARMKGGREPYFDYHILTVGEHTLSPSTRERRHHDGDDYLVRQHLRRGHIRRLSPTHRIWVNQSLVAAGSRKGVVGKDYRVR